MWYDGDMYIVSGPDTRKSKNLAQNPNCTLAFRLTGLDLILEGTAARVTDTATLEALAARYNAGGWPVKAEGDAFTAPFQRPQCRATALVPLPRPLPHRLRRRLR